MKADFAAANLAEVTWQKIEEHHAIVSVVTLAVALGRKFDELAFGVGLGLGINAPQVSTAAVVSRGA